MAKWILLLRHSIRHPFTLDRALDKKALEESDGRIVEG